MAVCAAPEYLVRRGTPRHPSELDAHEAVAFAPSARSAWKFTRGDESAEASPVRMITVNNGQAVRAAARAGLGIIMQPEILVRRDFETGSLTPLLTDWRLGERPMWLVYFRDRRMTPRLSSFISFAISTFGASENIDKQRSSD